MILYKPTAEFLPDRPSVWNWIKKLPLVSLWYYSLSTCFPTPNGTIEYKWRRLLKDCSEFYILHITMNNRVITYVHCWFFRMDSKSVVKAINISCQKHRLLIWEMHGQTVVHRIIIAAHHIREKLLGLPKLQMKTNDKKLVCFRAGLRLRKTKYININNY